MIYKKLLEFQKLGITIKKGSANPFFKSNYANLNEVLDKVTKPLNNLGVVIIQKPAQLSGMTELNTTNAFGLVTVLHDTEDDTSVESFTPFVSTSDMQKLGSAITYARRYALVSMLSLEDEDDDGNKASDKEKSVTPTDDGLDL